MPAGRRVRVTLAAVAAALVLGAAPTGGQARVCELPADEAWCPQVVAVADGLVAVPSVKATVRAESPHTAQTTAASIAAAVSAAVLLVLAVAVVRPLHQ